VYASVSSTGQAYQARDYGGGIDSCECGSNTEIATGYALAMTGGIWMTGRVVDGRMI
jgi:hypothetical protein